MRGETTTRWVMLFCGILTVLLQITHVVKLSPIHDLEVPAHVQMHLDEVAHAHDDGVETISEDELPLIKMHVFMHANLAFCLSSEALTLPALEPLSVSPPHIDRDFSSLYHRPPVPPPLA